MIGGTWESQQVTTGDRQRYYRYSSPDADPLANAILQSIQKRHEKKVFSETAEAHTPQSIDNEHPTQYSDPIQEEGVRYQNPTEQAIAPTPENNDFWTPENLIELEQMKAIALQHPDDNDEIKAFLSQFIELGAIA